MLGHKLKKFINLSAPILITGETGTGKSYLAKKIFEQSLINREKFLTAHLASLKEDLIESELFGYKRGAFTGALECKNGYLKDVGAGTLFLDEVGELSLEAQKKLLYLLEEKKFTPLGSTIAQDFRGRIIMATNKNLLQMVSLGLFREDLFYRISVFKLELPSFKTNRELLSSSIDNIFLELKKKYHKNHYDLPRETREHLLELEWKGNFRELRNTLEYGIVMTDGPEIKISDFPISFNVIDSADKASSEKSFLEHFPDDFNKSLELFESMYLRAIFQKNNGKVNDTARRLGMSKTTLIQKAKKYGINTLQIRAEASVLAA